MVDAGMWAMPSKTKGKKRDWGVTMTPERRHRLRDHVWQTMVFKLGTPDAVRLFGEFRPPMEHGAVKCCHPVGVVCPMCYGDWPESEK